MIVTTEGFTYELQPGIRGQRINSISFTEVGNYSRYLKMENRMDSIVGRHFNEYDDRAMNLSSAVGIPQALNTRPISPEEQKTWEERAARQRAAHERRVRASTVIRFAEQLVLCAGCPIETSIENSVQFLEQCESYFAANIEATPE